MMSPVDAFRTSRDVRLESGMRAKADVRRPLRAMGSRPNLPDGQITSDFQKSCQAPFAKIFRFAPDPNQFTDSHRLVASHPRSGVHEQAGRNAQTGIFCRGQALLDSERKNFWLAKAQEWEQRALDEMHFTSRNAIAITPIVK